MNPHPPIHFFSNKCALNQIFTVHVIDLCFYVLYIVFKQLIIISLYIIFTVNFNNIQAILWGHKVSGCSQAMQYLWLECLGPGFSARLCAWRLFFVSLNYYMYYWSSVCEGSMKIKYSMFINELRMGNIRMPLYNISRVWRIPVLASSQTMGLSPQAFSPTNGSTMLHSLVYIKICMNHINQSNFILAKFTRKTLKDWTNHLTPFKCHFGRLIKMAGDERENRWESSVGWFEVLNTKATNEMKLL